MLVESDSTILELGKYIAGIRPLFEEMGALKLFEPVYAMYTSFNDPTIRIMVAGGSNCGKSRFANHLLGQNLFPVTSVPCDTEMTVLSQPESTPGWVLEAETKLRPMEQLPAYLNGPAAGARPVIMHVQSSLIGEHPFRFAERLLPSSDAPNYESSLRQRIYSSDIILLVMDAHAALKRDEVRFFQACMLYGFTPAIVLAKTDTLSDEERETVLSYVRKQFEFSSVDDLIVCTGKDGIAEAEQLRKWFVQRSIRTNVAETRRYQIMYALSERLEGLRRDAQAGVNSLQLEQAEKEKIVREKQNRFEGQRLLWDSIDVELSKRRNSVIESARAVLEQAEDEMYRELVHRLDDASDIKRWWEKKLPHDIHLFDGLLKKSEREIQQKIIQDFQWFCGEVAERFRSTFSGFAPRLIQIDYSAPEVDTLKKMNFSDAERLKTFSRVGTVVAVVAGGAILTTAGIGVAVVAIGALAGLAGEKYVKYKVGQDKELAKPELRKSITQARMECMQKLSRQITDEYASIASILQEQQRIWEEKFLDAVKKELEAALPQTLDWEACLKRVDAAIAELNQLVR